MSKQVYLFGLHDPLKARHHPILHIHTFPRIVKHTWNSRGTINSTGFMCKSALAHSEVDEVWSG